MNAIKNCKIQHKEKNSGGDNTRISLINIRNALNELKTFSGLEIPTNIFELTPEEIYASEDKLFELLEFLRYVNNLKNGHMEKPYGLEEEYFSLADPGKSIKTNIESEYNKKTSQITPFQLESGNIISENTYDLKPTEIHSEIDNKSPIIQQSENNVVDTPRLVSENINVTKKNEENRPLQIKDEEISEQNNDKLIKNAEILKNEEEVQENDNKIDPKTKLRVLEWLESINLIKHGVVNPEEFPGYCRNGVLISDLISRIEGVFFIFFYVNL